ncbi:hypothetical protein PRZ48_000686 [Zasmidium cellare]|uniref:Protein ZIP4 homolog n=1 Tax=Zasmidium cellare TaxID=395010 RepID=A0ABR0F0S9_ZASCE|nr:hypothetical protein PRZ48_000686 [Zasmidium cellare]
MSRPKMPQKKEAMDKLVQDITDFATRLHDLLNNRQPMTADTSRELERHMKQLPLNGSVLGKQARTLDALGTELWNISAGLINDTQRDPRPKATDPTQQGVLIRVFAFLLLDSANPSQSSKKKSEDLQTRTLTVALRAARLCLDKNELNLALRVLERCSPRIPESQEEDVLFQMDTDATEDRQTFETTMKDLKGEFYLLRLLHSWKSARLDLAEHYHAKISLSGTSPTSNLAVKAADLFYEIARSLSKLGKQDDAVKWFERAWGVSDQVSPDHLSQEGAELLMSIGVSFADVLLSSQQTTHRKRAWEVASKLEQTHGLSNRLTIPILKFQILANERRVDPDHMANTLLHIVKLAVLTEENFAMIMKTLRKACEKSCTTALHALRTFICHRLLPDIEDNSQSKSVSQGWLEKASVAYILFHTRLPTFAPATSLDDLQDLFDTISNTLQSPFTAKATHAAQTLMWKAIGQSSGNTFKWCQLLRHPLFENAGYINKARIGRKLMCIAIDEGNIAAAREAFYQMPETARNDGPSRLLAFRAALVSRDDDFAMESLQAIAKTVAKDPTFLYACVLESQQHGMGHMTLAALKAVLSQQPSGIQMPALLRCAARLAVSINSDQDYSNDDTALEVIKLFERASHHIQDLRQLSKTQWTAENQWWSKNSYNFALRQCKEMPPDYTVRMLEVCAAFMDCYPTDNEQQPQNDLRKRRLLCAFLSTTALIVMGRSGEVGSEHTNQCFLHARDQIVKFKLLQAEVGNKDLGPEATARMFAMLKFELECIMQLQQWERLNDTLRECLEVRPVERWDALADLIIIMHEHLDAPSQESHYEMITQVLQRIINDTWKKQKEIVKVARWVRFTFTLCLKHTQNNFSLKLLGQAATMAENGYRGKQDHYPESELQWLATTSFNRAIDILVEEENDAEAFRWMDAALGLAKWSQDSGSLHAILTGKREAAEQHVRDREMQA